MHLNQCGFYGRLPNLSFSWKIVKFNLLNSKHFSTVKARYFDTSQTTRSNLVMFVFVLRTFSSKVTFVALPSPHSNSKLVYRLSRAQRVMAFFVSVYFVTLIPAGLFFFYFQETLTCCCWRFFLLELSVVVLASARGSSDISIDIISCSERLPPLAERWSAY